ncbi:MAG: CoA activase, partial [Desulfobacteraceae bacterium]
MAGYYLGMDIGSVSANTVILSESNQVLKEDYQRTKGQPLETALSVLQDFFQEYPSENCRSLTLTGTAGKLVAEILKVPFVNEIIAQARAVDFFHPRVRTIIEMGGEDSKLILLTEEASGDLAIQDFAMNTLCAAGTGSFLDQQAHRLGLTIEDFSALALKSSVPPRIAGRCTVFAKTDMIHLQQEATPDYDIIAGLCFAVARNLKSNIAKGKNIIKPVAFQGGVAANAGMRKAFFDILELKEGELVIPRHFASMGAIGAAFLTLEEKGLWKKFEGLERLREYITQEKPQKNPLEPLVLSDHHLKRQEWKPLTRASAGEKKIPAYLGIDVGSISTNV